MDDFVRGDCHKCKFEITAECVPRSQKMGFPNCYKTTMTNADRIRAMSDEELAKKMSGLESFALTCGGGWPPEKWLDWLRQEAKDGKQD